MFHRTFLIVSVISLLLLSPIQPYAWQWTDSSLNRTVLPLFVQPVWPMEVDFDGDGSIETVKLSGEQVSIRNGAEIRWESPKSWQVQQVQIADLNNDKLPEIVLLVWRPFKPWPVDTWLPKGGRIEKFHNAAGMSCHIILIGWNGNSFRERWAGSAMAEPVKSFVVADLDGLGKQFLITLETSYENSPSAPAQKLKVWEWNGFGFTVVSQVQGVFNQLAAVMDNNGRMLILAP